MALYRQHNDMHHFFLQFLNKPCVRFIVKKGKAFEYSVGICVYQPSLTRMLARYLADCLMKRGASLYRVDFLTPPCQ